MPRRAADATRRYPSKTGLGAAAVDGIESGSGHGGRSGWQMQNKEQFGKFRIQLRGFM